MGETSALGARLKELRLARGLSQRDVGGRELSASYVSLIESGKRRPTAEALRTMCEQLGTTPQALAAGGEVEVPRTRAEVELDLKWAKIAIRAGNPASAEKYARVVLEDGSLDERDRLEALSLLAAATEGQGRLDEAISMLEDLQSQIDPVRTRELWLTTQVTLQRCYRETGDVAHAISLGEQAMARMDLTQRDEELTLVIGLAEAHSLAGNFTRARMLLTTVISRAENAGSQQARGRALWNASLVAADSGRFDDAIRLSENALAALSESASSRSIGRLHANCGYVLLEVDGEVAVPRARAHYETALEYAEAEDSLAAQARIVTELARCDLLEHRLDDAEVRLLQAQAMLHAGDDGVEAERAFAHFVEGHVLVARGDLARGLDLAVRAAEQTEAQESGEEAARTWSAVADLAEHVGAADVQLTALRRATTLAGLRSTKVGLPQGPAPTSDPVSSEEEWVLAGRE